MRNWNPSLLNSRAFAPCREEWSPCGFSQYRAAIDISFYFPFGKLRSRPEFLELMSQMCEFQGSSSVLKVQVKSQGQRFFWSVLIRALGEGEIIFGYV